MRVFVTISTTVYFHALNFNVISGAIPSRIVRIAQGATVYSIHFNIFTVVIILGPDNRSKLKTFYIRDW